MVSCQLLIVLNSPRTGTEHHNRVGQRPIALRKLCRNRYLSVSAFVRVPRAAPSVVLSPCADCLGDVRATWPSHHHQVSQHSCAVPVSLAAFRHRFPSWKPCRLVLSNMASARAHWAPSLPLAWLRPCRFLGGCHVALDLTPKLGGLRSFTCDEG